MRVLMLMAGAAAIAVGAPALADDKDKNPNAVQGNGERGDRGKARGNGRERSETGNQGRDSSDRDGGIRDAANELRQRTRSDDRSVDQRVDPRPTADSLADIGRPGAADRIVTVARFIDGCPPGLAKKRNGCLPPGQARKLYSGTSRYASLFDGIPYRYRSRYGDGHRYHDGYLYRIDGEEIGGWLPVLGGALSVGQIFPGRYPDSDVPAYYNSYYQRESGYRYRYADRAIFAVDPETRAIRSIAALLTGDDWVVGRAAPEGYGIYNVPLQYRDRYYDTDDVQYRYSDGYVYRIDPQTQLVAAAISLLS